MKKLVRIASLSVALCLCCCFSTFGSVKASALTVFDAEPMYTGEDVILFIDSSDLGAGNWSELDYVYSIPTGYNPQSLVFNWKNGFVLNFDFDLYDYYLSISLTNEKIIHSTSLNEFSFYPNAVYLRQFDDGVRIDTLLENLNIFDCDANPTTFPDAKGFYCYGQITDLNDNYMLSSIYIDGSGYIPKTDYLRLQPYIYRFPKDVSSDYIQGVISAINNQTNQLSSDIGQAADDIQQSIEEQYQMEEEEDFGFSDIQEQYEEKMGVLTFGTETTLQMLDLFSPSNAGDAYIRVPGFSIDVQGESYQVWDDYVFEFSWIEEWIPLLIRLMRTFNVTMFYIAILSYINKVYERNFLAK